MNYGRIIETDIANGPGVRVSLFVSGCRNHCRGCFQPETWAFDYGDPYTKETEDHIIELLRPKHIQGLTILGGDPFEPENQKPVENLVKRVNDTFGKDSNGKNIWVFTGYLFEDLWKSPGARAILENIDVLVDGPFNNMEYQLGLQFRGSKNQRIIDIGATLMNGSDTPTPSLWMNGQYK